MSTLGKFFTLALLLTTLELGASLALGACLKVKLLRACQFKTCTTPSFTNDEKVTVANALDPIRSIASSASTRGTPRLQLITACTR